MALRLRAGVGLTERPPAGVSQPPSPPPWTPLALPGLALWLAADGTGTLRDDPGGGAYTGPLHLAPSPEGTWFLAQWDDISGQGRHATQATAVQQPEFVPSELAGYPAIRFDGVLSALGLPALSSLTEGEIFIVLRLRNDPPADAARSGLWTLGTAAAAGVRYPDTDGVIRDGFGATDLKTTVDPAASLAQAHVYNAVTKPGEWTSRLNGVQLFTTAANAVGFPTAPILGESLDGVHLDGDVHEVLLCAPLDAATGTQTLQYLAGKYGIALA